MSIQSYQKSVLPDRGQTSSPQCILGSLWLSGLAPVFLVSLGSGWRSAVYLVLWKPPPIEGVGGRNKSELARTPRLDLPEEA